MKKIVLFLLVAVVTVGAAWGQAFTVAQIPNSIALVDFDNFFVDGVASIESQYSQGIFTSYADDFLWFTGYDAKVGTFLLFGGQASSGYTLNLGFAKTLKTGYLGLYFGGDLVNASGTNNGLTGDDNATSSDATWNNKLSVLYGKEGLGGIRFDILFPNSHYEDTLINGKPGSQEVTDAPSIGLGWGTTLANGMEAYAQLGYRFANMTVTGNSDGSKQDTEWGTSRLALQAGIEKPLSKTDNSESSLSVDVLIGNVFGGSGDGDLALKDHRYVNGGIFLFGADAAYKQKINLGKLSLGFKPGVALGFTVDDSSSAITGSKTVNDRRKIVGFEVAADIDLGVKFQINEKFSLYSGLGLSIFDFRTGGYAEGKDDEYDKTSNPDVKSSAWQISGLGWKGSDSKLSFGLTYEPAKNIVIGAGISSLLDKFFEVDFQDMSFKTKLNDTNGDTELEWLSNNIFGGLEFELLVTIKF